MRLLLDAHILLWIVSGHERLDSTTRRRLAEADAIYVSAVTIWEIAIKRALGKLDVDIGALLDRMKQDGLVQLPIVYLHGVVAAALPSHHRDPFDRMLLAQAHVECLKLISVDSTLRNYDGLVEIL